MGQYFLQLLPREASESAGPHRQNSGRRTEGARDRLGRLPAEKTPTPWSGRPKAESRKVVSKLDGCFQSLFSENTDLIVLAGYMKVLEPAVIDAIENRIINIHPSLIPKYCGRIFTASGCIRPYGRRREGFGATVHFRGRRRGHREIILQRKVPCHAGRILRMSWLREF